jgi:hypothetical protein
MIDRTISRHLWRTACIASLSAFLLITDGFIDARMASRRAAARAVPRHQLKPGSQLVSRSTGRM